MNLKISKNKRILCASIYLLAKPVDVKERKKERTHERKKKVVPV